MTILKINQADKNSITLGGNKEFNDTIYFELPTKIDAWQLLVQLKWTKISEYFEIELILVGADNNELKCVPLPKQNTNSLYLSTTIKNFNISAFKISSDLKDKKDFEIVVKKYESQREFYDYLNIPNEEKEILKKAVDDGLI